MASNEQDNTTTTAVIEQLLIDVRSASGRRLPVLPVDKWRTTILVVMKPNNAGQIVQTMAQLSAAITQRRQLTYFQILQVELELGRWHGDDPTDYAIQIFRALDNPYSTIDSVKIGFRLAVDVDDEDEEGVDAALLQRFCTHLLPLAKKQVGVTSVDFPAAVCRAIFDWMRLRADNSGLTVQFDFDILLGFSIQEILDACLEINFRGKIDCLFELSPEGEDWDGLELLPDLISRTRLSGIRLDILAFEHPPRMFSDIVLAIQRRTDLRSFELSCFDPGPEISQAVFEATASRPGLEYFGFSLNNVSEPGVLMDILLNYLSQSTCPKVMFDCDCEEMADSVWTNFALSATTAVQSNARLQDFDIRISVPGKGHYSQMPVEFQRILARNRYLAAVQSGLTFSRPELAQALGTLAKKHQTVQSSAMYELIRTNYFVFRRSS